MDARVGVIPLYLIQNATFHYRTIPTTWLTAGLSENVEVSSCQTDKPCNMAMGEAPENMQSIRIHFMAAAWISAIKLSLLCLTWFFV